MGNQSAGYISNTLCNTCTLQGVCPDFVKIIEECYYFSSKFKVYTIDQKLTKDNFLEIDNEEIEND